jgi:signal transduction histidine kinase
MHLLQTIAVASNETHAIGDALQIALDEVCRLTGWPIGHVYVTTPTGDLAPSGLWHVDYPARFETFRQITARMTFSRGVGLPGRVLASGTPLWVIDVTKDANFPRAKAAGDIGVRAAFGFPVLIGQEVVAVLEFFSNVPLEPDESLLAVMGNVGTQLGRVMERRRAEDALLAKQTLLEIASKHKSQFLANMSHELRTPLNAILGYTQLIVNRIYGDVPDKIADALARVELSGRHLLALINDVLDLSKIEAGQLTLSLKPYRMRELLHEVLAAMQPLAEAKGLLLTASAPDDLPTATGDDRRMKQVLLNLIGNAIKFTERGTVAIDVAQTGDRVTIRIADTGPGISPADQARIFEEFQQADSSTTREKGGTGLGLAIVRRIVGLHGGTVGVESVLGHGSTFWLTIPLVAQRQEARP